MGFLEVLRCQYGMEAVGDTGPEIVEDTVKRGKGTLPLLHLAKYHNYYILPLYKFLCDRMRLIFTFDICIKHFTSITVLIMII